MHEILPARTARDAPNVEKLDSAGRTHPTASRRRVRWLAGALALALLLGPRCGLGGPVTLMSYNLYLGADLAPLIAAQSEPEFVAAVGTAFGSVVATNFNVRANAIADQIAASKPHFIGLQEVSTLSIGSPVDFGQTPPPATTVAFDYLQILLGALASKGLSYAPIAQIENLSIQVPGAVSQTQLASIGFTDSDVLLAMTNLPTGMTFANAQGQNFATKLPVPILGTTIEIPRGWTAADVTVDGNTFRLVNTHLESFFEPVQLGQALELLGGPGNTALPLVFIGDFNSAAAPPALAPGATYGLLLGPGGFTDAGALGGIGDEPTCCQAANLLNLDSLLETRIDLALFRGGFPVISADVVGEAAADRIASGGLWPSDHAGIVVTLLVPEPATALLLAWALVLLRNARSRRGAAQ